jgi:hypothetical protein
LKLNYSKTEILQLGEISYSNNNPFNIRWVKDRVYALGTWFYKELDDVININYKARIKVFLNVLKHWKCRNLTWFGKLTVLKSLAISKLNYCISTLETPEWFTVEVQNAINDFLWNGNTPKIKYRTVIGDICDGGLKMPDIHTYIMAQKAVWAKRLFNSEPSHCFAYLQEFLPDMNIHDILNLSVDPNVLSDKIPLFYRQALHAWYLTKGTISTIDEVLSEIIWYNRDIQINGECIMYEEWYKQNIVHVYDLLHESGRFFTYDEFINIFNVNCRHYRYMSVIDAIPQNWKLIIKHHKEETTNFDMQYSCSRKFGTSIKPIEKIQSRHIYWKFIYEHFTEPTCIQSWKRTYGFEFEEKEWKCVFELPHLLTKDVKLKEFQTKIIHRVYASNSYVSNFDNTVNEKCTQCNIKSDICHMFYLCENVRPFWHSVEKWYTAQIDKVDLSLKDVILGKVALQSHLINYCILHAKWFLHKQYKNTGRNSNKNSITPSFLQYLIYLKNSVTIEKCIAQNRNSEEYFNTVFSKLEECL